MKIYGYSKSDDAELLELSEATVSASPETLRKLASFLIKCAEEIEGSGELWEHEHFSKITQSCPEIIIHNPGSE